MACDWYTMDYGDSIIVNVYTAYCIVYTIYYN